MARDNSTGKTKEFYDKGQAIFDGIPGLGGKKFFVFMKAAGVAMTQDMASHIIDTYRFTYPTIPKLWEGEMKISTAEIDKALADWPRVKPAPAEPLENWYYLDECHVLHQLGKEQTFEDAYAEMEIAATKRGRPFITLVCEDNAREWRVKLDRWLGDDGYRQKYRKREGDL